MSEIDEEVEALSTELGKVGAPVSVPAIMEVLNEVNKPIPLTPEQVKRASISAYEINRMDPRNPAKRKKLKARAAAKKARKKNRSKK